MDIRVSGHQVDVGDALRSHATASMLAADEKYQMRGTSAQVTFGKGPHDHGFTCEIVAYAPQGVVLKAADQAADARPAFDAAAEKVEKQLRRHSRKMKDHRAGGTEEVLEIVAGSTDLRRGEG